MSPRTRHALSLPPNERFAAKAVAAFCDRHGVRVLCLSTPATIYRDLQGHRREELPRKQRRVTAIGTRPETLRLPEPAMLSRISRRDLWGETDA